MLIIFVVFCNDFLVSLVKICLFILIVIFLYNVKINMFFLWKFGFLGDNLCVICFEIMVEVYYCVRLLLLFVL